MEEVFGFIVEALPEPMIEFVSTLVGDESLSEAQRDGLTAAARELKAPPLTLSKLSPESIVGMVGTGLESAIGEVAAALKAPDAFSKIVTSDPGLLVVKFLGIVQPTVVALLVKNLPEDLKPSFKTYVPKLIAKSDSIFKDKYAAIVGPLREVRRALDGPGTVVEKATALNGRLQALMDKGINLLRAKVGPLIETVIPKASLDWLLKFGKDKISSMVTPFIVLIRYIRGKVLAVFLASRVNVCGFQQGVENAIRTLGGLVADQKNTLFNEIARGGILAVVPLVARKSTGSFPEGTRSLAGHLRSQAQDTRPQRAMPLRQPAQVHALLCGGKGTGTRTGTVKGAESRAGAARATTAGDADRTWGRQARALSGIKRIGP